MKVFKDNQAPRNPVAPYNRGALEEFAPSPPVEIAGLEEYEEPPLAETLTPQDVEQLRLEVLAQAEEEAQRQQQEAYEAGFREGEAAGRAAFDEKAGACLEAIMEAMARLEERQETFISETTPMVLLLLQRLATRVLQREATLDQELIGRSVQAALRLIGEAQTLTISLHPDDLAALKEMTELLMEKYPGIASLRFHTDESISRGGALLDSESLHIDAQLESVLAELFTALET